MRTPEEHKRAQLRIITTKNFLGDDEATRQLERGTEVAKVHAKMAARNQGLCDCTRTDGIVCGRQLSRRAGHLCWPCWGREQDDKPCDHTGKR